MYIVSRNRQPAPPSSRRSASPAVLPQTATHRSPAPAHEHHPNLDCEISNSVQPSNGYLGYTSHSSVFEETENALGVSMTTTATPDAESISGRSKVSKPTPRTLNACLRILNFIPDPETGVGLFKQAPTMFDIIPHAIGRRILCSLYETFGRYLGKSRNPRDLEFLARKLCANTARPFAELESDPDRWTAQFVGENLRWESIGILFTFWDLYPAENAIPPFQEHRKANYADRVLATRESLRLCLEVCLEFSSGNALTLHVSQKFAVVESMFSGDASRSNKPLGPY